MDRYYKSGAVATPPSGADPSSGDYPTAGNPQTSTPATKPGPYWFFMITESLRHVIVAAGLTPNRLSLTLLRDAIIQLIAVAVQAALTPTGMLGLFMRSTAPAGWVRVGGGTIGDSLSGASERAHADCHDLYVGLWNDFPQSVFPVIGGRGVSAEDDWNAHKRLTLVDHQGLYLQAWDYSGGVKPGQSLGGLVTGRNKKHTHLVVSSAGGPPNVVTNDRLSPLRPVARTAGSVSEGQNYSLNAPTADGLVADRGLSSESGGDTIEVDSRCWLLCAKL